MINVGDKVRTVTHALSWVNAAAASTADLLNYTPLAMDR